MSFYACAKSLIAAATLIGAFMASPLASAQEILDTMRASFGNTVRVTAPTGSYDAFYNADGTFTNSQGVSGTWRIEGSTLTLNVDGQDVGSATLPAGKGVGDHFQMHDEAGNPVEVELVAGRP